MRILIATPLLPTQPGGPGQYGYQLSLALNAKGHTVTIIDFQKVKRFPTGIRHLLLCATLIKSMRGVDAVIALDTVSMALPAVLGARLCGVRSVVRVGGDFVWEHFIERTKQKVTLSEFYTLPRSLSWKEKLLMWLQKHIVFRLAGAVVFSTAWQRDIWSDPYHISSTKVHVVENAYAPMEQLTTTHHPSSKRIVWIGRDLVLKNVDTLDSAIALVREKYPDIEFKKYSSISHLEVIEALRNCRMLVIPSVSEVSPNLVFEALACTVPVLLTNDCGLRNQLQENVVWINAMDVADIAQKIETLMRDTEYTAMSARIQEHQYTRTYVEVADDLLALVHSS